MPECYIRGSMIKYLRIPDEIIDMVKEDQVQRTRQRDSNRGGRGGSNQRGRGGHNMRGMRANNAPKSTLNRNELFYYCGIILLITCLL